MKRVVRQPTPNQTIASGTQAMPETAVDAGEHAERDAERETDEETQGHAAHARENVVGEQAAGALSERVEQAGTALLQGEDRAPHRRRRRHVDRRQPAVDGVQLPECAQHEERDRAEQDSSEPPAPESRHRWTSPQRWMVSD